MLPLRALTRQRGMAPATWNRRNGPVFAAQGRDRASGGEWRRVAASVPGRRALESARMQASSVSPTGRWLRALRLPAMLRHASASPACRTRSSVLVSCLRRGVESVPRPQPVSAMPTRKVAGRVDRGYTYTNSDVCSASYSTRRLTSALLKCNGRKVMTVNPGDHPYPPDPSLRVCAVFISISET